VRLASGACGGFDQVGLFHLLMSGATAVPCLDTGPLLEAEPARIALTRCGWPSLLLEDLKRTYLSL